jgi:DNA-binding CsgD family transcriptional regulator
MLMIAPLAKCAPSSSDLARECTTPMELLGNAIANAGFGLVLVTANRKITFANHVAEKLMRMSSALRRESGCICASEFKTSRKLRSLISAASQPTIEALPGGSVILSNGEGLAPLVAHVVPLSRASTFQPPDNDRPVAGLFIVDCGRGITNRVNVFADLFALTPAEARVLAQLISGEALTLAAKRLNIARSTARYHLNHILEKSGVHRQADLVRLLFETTIPWNSSLAVPFRPRNKTSLPVSAWRTCAAKIPSISAGGVGSQR